MSVNRRVGSFGLLLIGIAAVLWFLGKSPTNAMASGSAAAALATPHNKGQDTPHAMALIVDGSRTPDAISDELAYKHFLTALAIQDRPVFDMAMRDALLRKVGLDATDFHFATQVVSRIGQDLRPLISRRAQLLGDTVPDEASLGELRQQETAVLAAARKTLTAGLSANGRWLLTDYINRYVKSNIRIYAANM